VYPQTSDSRLTDVSDSFTLVSSLENLPDDDELSIESVQRQSRVSDSRPAEYPGPMEHPGPMQQSSSTDDVQGENNLLWF